MRQLLEPRFKTVSLEHFEHLIDMAVGSIKSDPSFQPDSILALSTGGFPVAASLAKRLNISSRRVVGIPAYKDETGDYHLDTEILKFQSCIGLSFLVVDDASNRGLLTKKAVQVVEGNGGSARSCVLIANENGVLPDYLGETCPGKPPKFFWEPISKV